MDANLIPGPPQPQPGSPESQLDFALQYKIAFDTWQFHVKSLWQRSAWFAALHSLALAAAWKILGFRSAIALSVAGTLFVAIWYLSNLKLHGHIRYWWATIQSLERADFPRVPLAIDSAARYSEFRIPRYSFLRDSTLLNAMPLVFLMAWLWMLVVSIVSSSPSRNSTSPVASLNKVLPPAVTPNSPIMTGRPEPRVPAQDTNSQQAAQQSETTTSEGAQPAEQPKDFARLSAPNTFYGAGLSYGVDHEGNRYVLADLAHEAGLMTYPTQPPYSTVRALILNRDIDELIDRNRWGDLVSRTLFVVEAAAKKRGLPAGDVELQVLDVAATATDLTNAAQALRGSPFWRQHRENYADLRLFFIAETISSKHLLLNFPRTDPQILNQAFAELRELGSDTFVPRTPTSIDVRSRLPLVLACKSVELDTKNSSQTRLGPRMLPARFEEPGRWNASVTRIKEISAADLPVLETVPLPSTHYTDAPAQLASFPRNATYGAVLDELKQKVSTAGFNEVRIYDSGFGFALATRFEVTSSSGIPLPGDARFLPGSSASKKLRGYYITVTAHPRPTEYVSTSRPQDIFSMRYGLTALPNDMDQIQILPGTSVRVYVLEFRNQSGITRQIPNQECAASAPIHMKQSGILKP